MPPSGDMSKCGFASPPPGSVVATILHGRAPVRSRRAYSVSAPAQRRSRLPNTPDTSYARAVAYILISNAVLAAAVPIAWVCGRGRLPKKPIDVAAVTVATALLYVLFCGLDLLVRGI